MFTLIKEIDLFKLNADYYYCGSYTEELSRKCYYTRLYEINFQVIPVLSIVAKGFLRREKTVLINNIFCMFMKRRFSENETFDYIKKTIEKMVQIYLTRGLNKPIIFPMSIIKNDYLDRIVMEYLDKKSEDIDITIIKRG
jgi:hypothetical protein